MRILYPDYRFEMLSIIVGALEFVPSCLFNYMTDLGFEKKEATRNINKMQGVVISGTVKICEAFLNFKLLELHG